MQIEIFLIAKDDHHRSHHHHHHQSLSHFTQGREDTENTALISSLSEIKGKCWELSCYLLSLTFGGRLPVGAAFQERLAVTRARQKAAG